VAQLHQYFPKLCPPYCGLEINFRRIKNNPKIRVITLAEVQNFGNRGQFRCFHSHESALRERKVHRLRSVRPSLHLEIDNPFNYGMDKIKQPTFLTTWPSLSAMFSIPPW